MESHLHLGSLPAEIRSIIIGMVKSYAQRQQLRFISKSWNAAIAAVNDPPLYISRVYLHSGQIANVQYENHGAQFNTDARKRVHMYAIIPDQEKERVGVGKWLAVHQRFPGAVEAKCEPYKFHSNSIVGNLIARLLRRERKERKGALFRKFFSMVAQIETLVLDHMSDPFFKVFDVMISTLGEVRIARLEVKELKCDEELFIRIVKLVQKHGIRHLTILCNECCEEIGEYLVKLVKLGVTIDLYEEDLFKVNRGYFQQTYKFWKEMEAKVQAERVYLKRMSKLGDEPFNTHAMDTRVRTHLHCSSSNQMEEANNDVVSRGFNRSFLPYFKSTRHLGS